MRPGFSTSLITPSCGTANVAHVVLHSPAFRAQTKADKYPARVNDLSSAILYSTWNQAIAATVRGVSDKHGKRSWANYLLSGPEFTAPVYSTSTEYILSKHACAIKAALKFAEEECQLLRAHSAVQRPLPVVEWHQRTEASHSGGTYTVY